MIRRIAKAFAALLIAFVIAEGLARLYLATLPDAYTDYLLSRPAAYDHSAYYSPAFVREIVAAQNAFDLDSHGLFIQTDHAGQYMNIVAGYRVTPGQPTTYQHTVWLFGNSTLFGYDVPDAATIAAYLQALRPADRIVNLGATGETIHLQRIRLETITPAPGDTVVFLDGSFDAAMIDQRSRNAKPSLLKELSCISSLAIARIACGLQQTITPDRAIWLGQIATLKIAATEDLQAASAYATSRGARFYHFLQPYLSSIPKGQATPAEQSEWSDDYEALDGATFAMLRTIAPVIDITHTLDAIRLSQAVYIDGVHVNEIGNAAIAGAIDRAIR